MVKNLKVLFKPLTSLGSFLLKYIDKFLKFLKTDRNTFLTYILTLISAYLLIDRVVEMLMIIFTGISVSYWGPIQYTLAFACPVFAFLFSGSSKYADSQTTKLTLFYTYVGTLYTMILSMVVQWVNFACWQALLSVPNYHIIATEFGNLIKPAFSAVALYFPLTSFYKPIMWIVKGVNDTKDLRDSIGDFSGLDLSDQTVGTGEYTCEIEICKDKDTAKTVKIPESKRFESTLVVGVSGSGKTSMIFEPCIARDIEKKHFFKEMSKELAFAALKTGIATLKYPYTNEYINNNFNLNMLEPNSAKSKLYKSFMKKLILNASDNSIVYRNLGITYMSPDYESISHILGVAENYKMPVNLIDPNNLNSPGLNPFAFDDAIHTSIAIATVLKGIYVAPSAEVELAYRQNIASQAIENLAILLKEMYPKMHDGEIPTLEDLLDYLNDFDAIEAMCEEMKNDNELRVKYKILLSYFKKNFYKSSSSRADTEKFVSFAINQLDSLLRNPGIRNILCKRNNNMDFDKALENGEITLVCTRRGDLGADAHKAFGLFFILLMQYSVLRRPGTENSRVPNFFYLDEFPDFICSATEAMFTLYRKYRVANIVSAQNLDQLGVQKERYKQTILANCANKIVFGGNTPEDNKWWELELGQKREWTANRTYDLNKGEYDPKMGNIDFKWKANYAAGKVQSLKFKNCMYKVKNIKGKFVVGTGNVNFLDSKYKEPQNVKFYKFDKFTNGISEEENVKQSIKRRKKSSISGFADNTDTEINPIQIDSSDNYLEQTEDSAIFNLKRGNAN